MQAKGIRSSDQSEKRSKWRCPVGSWRVQRQFWGRGMTDAMR